MSMKRKLAAVMTALTLMTVSNSSLLAPACAESTRDNAKEKSIRAIEQIEKYIFGPISWGMEEFFGRKTAVSAEHQTGEKGKHYQGLSDAYICADIIQSK